MSRVEPEHVFLFAPEPAHPLDPAGLDNWVVVRTELRPTGVSFDDERGEYVYKITFRHYVGPPTPVRPPREST